MSVIIKWLWYTTSKQKRASTESIRQNRSRWILHWFFHGNHSSHESVHDRLRTQSMPVSLPPANEVWGKVIFSEACVKDSVREGGAIPACIAGGIPACLAVGLGGVWYPSMPCRFPVPHQRGKLRGIWQGGCLLLGVWGICLLWGVPDPGGLLLGGGGVEASSDGYCCGRYASYWNAFLFCLIILSIQLIA